MKLLEDILNKILLKESVSVSDVEDAIDNHKRVIINYHSKAKIIIRARGLLKCMPMALQKQETHA